MAAAKERPRNGRNSLLQRAGTLLRSLGRAPAITEDTEVTLVSCLGKGAFGTVFLARNKQHRVIAAKIFNKKHLINKKSVHVVQQEVSMLRSLEHPSIIHADSFGQTRDHVFYLMDYCSGGDFYTYLRRNEDCSEPFAVFYAAEILSAITFLHAQNIVFRDLKPENIMLDATGHVKLVDFGLAKLLPPDEKTFTVCGSSQYVAPEVLIREGYSHSVDVWALGCIIYEMLTGSPPFNCNSNKTKRMQKIMAGSVTYPGTISTVAENLLKQFFQVDVRKRIGCKADAGYLDEVWQHGFFQGVTRAQVESRELGVPYIPERKRSVDCTHFDDEFTSRAPTMPEYEGPPVDVPDGEVMFDGFPVVSDDYFAASRHKSHRRWLSAT